MRPWVGHPNYVYTPWSEDRRIKMRAVHRRRLGIPDGHVRIYGIHVPEDKEHPLRYYASYICQKRGWDAAAEFVRAAQVNGWGARKPSPTKTNKGDPNYVYRPWRNTINERIFRLSKGQPLCDHDRRLFGIPVPEDLRLSIWKAVIRADRFAGRDAARWLICNAWENGWTSVSERKRRTSTDWELVEELLSETASRAEIAAFFGISIGYLRNKLRQRMAAGLSSFGAGRKGFTV